MPSSRLSPSRQVSTGGKSSTALTLFSTVSSPGIGKPVDQRGNIALMAIEAQIAQPEQGFGLLAADVGGLACRLALGRQIARRIDRGEGSCASMYHRRRATQ